MLPMPASQIGHPVFSFILMKPYDRLFHPTVPEFPSTGWSASCYHALGLDRNKCPCGEVTITEEDQWA